MNCQQVMSLLHAYLDRELDVANEMALENHLHGCPGCEDAYKLLHVLQTRVRSDAKYYSAPAELRHKIRSSLGSSTETVRTKQRFWSTPGGTGSLALAMTILLSFSVITYERSVSIDDQLMQDVTSGHIRSLMAKHLTDVASSDQHQIKPWFNSKLDFSPQVRDFAELGYSLQGGRLDYLQNRIVAAIVYKHRQHVINLYMWPTGDDDVLAVSANEKQGYHLLSWKRHGMDFWLVSDLNKRELKEFARLLQND